MGATVADIQAILNVSRISKAIEIYLTLVGDAAAPANLGTEFAAGVEAVRRAGLTLRGTEQKSLLRDARAAFHRARDQVLGLHLALVQLGLALCHRHLGEEHGSKIPLMELLNIEPAPLAQDCAVPKQEPPVLPPEQIEALRGIRDILDLVTADKERQQLAVVGQQETIADLERLSDRIKRRAVQVFAKQLIVEKKKLLISSERERHTLDDLLRVTNEIWKSESRGALAAAVSDEPQSESARLAALQDVVRAYLAERAKLTYTN